MPGLAINEDADHFYFDRDSEKMTVKGLQELVDHYHTPQVKEILFNVNSQRTSYASKVWSTMWEGYDPNGPDDQPRLAGTPEDERPAVRKGIYNAFVLNQKGIDPFTVWIDRARELGHPAWLSMRMNDVHSVDNVNSYIHSEFWKSHPEFQRVPHRLEAWADRAFDYGHKEVRDYHMALIKEIFERYDFDGLELDWMRFGFHFRPGFEAEGCRLLIEFHREVRRIANEYAKRRKHPIRIGVRVPSRPQTARGMGLDAIAWAKLGLVDMIVITPFWATIEFDMPVELWKELMGEAAKNITLAAGLEINLRPTPKVWPKYADRVSTTAEAVFGAAASLLDRGADRIYLFNYMDSVTTVDNPEDYPKILNNAGAIETATAHARRHIVTYPDTWAPGEPPAYPLPATCSKTSTAAFRIHVGPQPHSGVARVIVGLGENGNIDPATLIVRVNSTLCPSSTAPLPTPIHPIARKSAGFEIPTGTLHAGFNLVEITSTLEEAQEIVWVEIMIA
jgi:hypothetical protein